MSILTEEGDTLNKDALTSDGRNSYPVLVDVRTRAGTEHPVIEQVQTPTIMDWHLNELDSGEQRNS